MKTKASTFDEQLHSSLPRRLDQWLCDHYGIIIYLHTKSKVPYEWIWKANNNNEKGEMAAFALDKLIEFTKRVGVQQSTITLSCQRSLYLDLQVSNWSHGYARHENE